MKSMSKLKKCLLLCLVASCSLFLFTGCNMVKDVQEAANSKDTVTTDEEADIEEKAAPGETADAETEEAEAESLVETDGPVLGQKDIDDYDGFTYLYCEQLRTDSTQNEETGKMESKELSVFIPVDEYNYLNRGAVSGESLGVSFDVELEPYIRYDEDDYLLSENLAYYLESQYDPFYSTDYKDLVVSEVEELGSNAARATAEYCYYNQYSDTYIPTFATYYLAELEDEVTVLVCMEVNAEDATGKTPQLIDELESFYPFEIDWDADRAQKKLEDYLAGGGDSTFSTGYLMFELPEGWAEDTDNSDYSTHIYAPDGDADFAGCAILIYDEYLGYGTVDPDALESNQDAMVAMVEEYLAESETEATVSYYGKTCLGVAVKCEMQVPYEDGTTANADAYYIFDESEMYIVTALSYGDATDDPFAVAEDILQNGQVPD